MKYTLIIILLFSYVSTYSQVTIKNTSLLSDTNLLFFGMENRIKITGSLKNVTLISKNGSHISANDSNTIVVIPKTLKPDILMVYIEEKLMLKKSFTIDTLPELKLQVGIIQSDTTTTREIIANKGLMTTLHGSQYYFPVHIKSFSATLFGSNRGVVVSAIPNIGNMFSPELEAIIKKLEPNSIITFHDLIGIFPDSRPRRFRPFSLVIK